MAHAQKIDPATEAHLTSVIYRALDKLKASMMDGPEGKPAELTPEEATMVYRALTESLGIPHA